MVPPRPVVAALLLAPSVVLSGAESWLVRHARQAGEELGRASASLAPATNADGSVAGADGSPPAAEGAPGFDGRSDAPGGPDAAESAAVAEGQKKHGKKGARRGEPVRAGAAPSPRGLLVDEATVLRLATAGHVPSGTPVGPSGARPAGLVLRGVSALGIGLAEGDVLTEVEGRPVRTEGQVIALVISARAHRLPRMSGRFFRGSEGWSLTVAMPYLTHTGASPPPDAPPAAGASGTSGTRRATKPAG